MEDQGIKDYFVFDQADLDANRKGNLSERQKKKLAGGNNRSKITSLLLVLFFFAIASIYPIIYIPLAIASWQQHDINGALGTLVVPAIWLLVWGGIGGFFLYSFIKDRQPVSKIILKKIAGPIHFVGKKNKPGQNIQFTLYIGRTKLEVVEDHLRSVMPEGDNYAVYYYKLKDRTGNHILSAEWFSNVEAKKDVV